MSTPGLLIFAVLLTACEQASEPEAPEQIQPTTPETQTLWSGIDVNNMDTKVRPGDDFFRYTNGQWLANNPIPEDRSAYDVFAVLRDAAQEDVKAIIEDAASGNHADGSDEQKVGDLFASYTDMETRNKTGFAPLHSIWQEIDQIGSHDELAVFFASANKRGYNMPFALDQYADFMDPNYYMIHTWQGGLGLPDREYYLKEGEKDQEIRDKYQAHIASMLELTGFSAGDADSAATLVMRLETTMAEKHLVKEETRNMVLLYNRVTREELAELMPSFNWQGYLEESDVAHLEWIVVTMMEHMRGLDPIIAETSIDDWKTWLKWAVLNSTANRLTAAVDEKDFEFYGKVLRGQEEQRPTWRRGVRVVNGTLGEVVGKVYVKKHFPPEAKASMQKLVSNLIRAYEVSIKELEWMGEDTRTQALDKLAKFTPKIGYPDEWRDYSSLSIKPDDLFGNLERASLAEYTRKIARQGGPVDRGEWAMNPQTVNAYYNPPLNEIVFPAAILQPPFFDMTADDAVNYGAIGAVIGHEIGHGFDDSGSRFDGDGVLRNWWTDDDRAAFEERTATLISQYNAFKPFDDLAVNGKFTLGENIGDLGGISIGLLAYQLSLGDSESPVMDGFTGVQRVFLGFGQVWRENIRDEALRQQIATDPHSPAEYRANGPVRNVPEFYEAFDVAETDALYLPPNQRVKIW